MPRLILASQSPYRLQLLRDAGFDAIAIPSLIDEPDPRSFGELSAGLRHLALIKGLAVANQGVSGIVLSADTVGHVNGEVYGKPIDRSDACRMLQSISGTVHEVLTGWCLLRTSDRLAVTGCETTAITMRPWSDCELDSYLDSNEWCGKCGAYGLQWPNDPFVTSIQGSAANVIGLPIETLTRVLNELNWLTPAE